jgi:hypothetical protein
MKAIYIHRYSSMFWAVPFKAHTTLCQVFIICIILWIIRSWKPVLYIFRHKHSYYCLKWSCLESKLYVEGPMSSPILSDNQLVRHKQIPVQPSGGCDTKELWWWFFSVVFVEGSDKETNETSDVVLCPVLRSRFLLNNCVCDKVLVDVFITILRRQNDFKIRKFVGFLVVSVIMMTQLWYQRLSVAVQSDNCTVYYVTRCTALIYEPVMSM